MPACGDECVLAAVRSATSLLCVVIISVLMIVVFCRMQWTNSVHRLLLYILFASLLKLLAYAAQLITVWRDSTHHSRACTGIGFTVQLTSWIVILITLWLTVYLVFRYWWPNREVLTFPREVGAWVGILVFSTLVAVIPIINRNYSASGAWCWIDNSNIEGVLEQWLLDYLWQILLAITVIVLLVLTIWHSRRRALLTEGGMGNRIAQGFSTEAKEIRLFTGWVTAYLALYVLTIIIRLVDQVIKGPSPLWLLIIFAIVVPIGVLVLPLAFLVHLHRIRRFRICLEREPLLPSHTHSDVTPQERRRNSAFQQPGRQTEDVTITESIGLLEHSET